MIRPVLTDIRRSVLSLRLLAATICGAALLLFAAWEEIWTAINSRHTVYAGYCARVILNAISSDGFIMGLPCLCVLPYSASWVEELQSGYLKFYLSRQSRKQYIAGKCTACWLGGGIAMVLALLVAYILAFSILMPYQSHQGELYIDKFVLVVARLFWSGGLWAIVGLAASSWTESIYMAYAFPFVFYYILIILHERYFEQFAVISPAEWLVPSYEWPLNGWSSVILLIAITAFIAFLFVYKAQKRLELL